MPTLTWPAGWTVAVWVPQWIQDQQKAMKEEAEGGDDSDGDGDDEVWDMFWLLVAHFVFLIYFCCWLWRGMIAVLSPLKDWLLFAYACFCCLLFLNFSGWRRNAGQTCSPGHGWVLHTLIVCAAPFFKWEVGSRWFISTSSIYCHDVEIATTS